MSFISAVIWNKVSRMVAAGMYDDLLKSLNKYITDQPRAAVDKIQMVNTARFYVCAVKNSAWEVDGVIVFGFAGDAIHSSLKVGDIITAIDGAPVENSDQFVALKKARAGQEFTMQVLRLNAFDAFEPLEIKVLVSDPPVGVCSLKVDE